MNTHSLSRRILVSMTALMPIWCIAAEITSDKVEITSDNFKVDTRRNIKDFNLKASDNQERSIKLTWDSVGLPPFEIWRSRTGFDEDFALIRDDVNNGWRGAFEEWLHVTYIDNDVYPGEDFYYTIRSSDGYWSDVKVGRCIGKGRYPKIKGLTITSLARNENQNMLVAGDRVQCEIRLDKSSCEPYAIREVLIYGVPVENKRRKEHYIFWNIRREKGIEQYFREKGNYKRANDVRQSGGADTCIIEDNGEEEIKIVVP